MTSISGGGNEESPLCSGLLSLFLHFFFLEKSIFLRLLFSLGLLNHLHTLHILSSFLLSDFMDTSSALTSERSREGTSTLESEEIEADAPSPTPPLSPFPSGSKEVGRGETSLSFVTCFTVLCFRSFADFLDGEESLLPPPFFFSGEEEGVPARKRAAAA